MPERVGPERVGAIDGLRAVAVAAVVAYHLDPHWLPSGFLGVDVFMVVSGFLITGLLVREYESGGRIGLGAFWIRRARRLLPAAFLLLITVAVWVRATGPDGLMSSVRSHGLAAVFYVTNWRLVADGTTYGGSVSGESPLVHLWSLAVEEQFYLLWPPVLLALLVLGRGRRLPVVAATGGAIASAVWMAALFEPGRDPLRIYYGTDTRAQAFLVGAVAALVANHRVARAARSAGPIAFGALFVLMLGHTPDFLYRGGFFVVALAAGVVCLAATMAGPVASLLDRRVLRAIGRVSYGVYLWHWPAIVLLTPERVGLSGTALTVARLWVTALGAVVSWVVVERPAQRITLPRFTFAGGAAFGVAFAMLTALPAASVVAFSSYRTDRIPDPVVVAPPTTGPDEPVPGATAPGMPPGTAMIVGDSGMLSATPALSAGLQAAGWAVVETAYPGLGLTQPADAIDGWGATARAHAVDLTIVMIGGWDVGWVRDHGDDAYRAVTAEAIAAFTAASGRVLWLSVLPGGDEDDRELEHIFSELPRRYPQVVDYLDIESSLRAPGGGWPEVVDGLRLRGPDGWHLCPDGAAAVARAALDHLALHAPGWEQGPWRADAAYHDPPGVCS